MYCDMSIMKRFMSPVNEGKFTDNLMNITDVILNLMMDITQKGKYKGAFKARSPDDGCFETEVQCYDSGFVKKFEISIDTDTGLDLDEGFDIYEISDGGIFMTDFK